MVNTFQKIQGRNFKPLFLPTERLLEEKFFTKREVWNRMCLTENPKSKILRGVFQNLLLESLRSEEKKVGVNIF